MRSRNLLLALCAFTAFAGAQTTISTTFAGAFVDITPTGNNLGTAIIGVTDDSVHSITTTIGNSMFPAGTVRVGNNGFAMSTWTTATVTLTNATIPATGLPVGATAGAGSYLYPYWDDLDPIGTTSGNITIYWWEDLTNNILYIQWNNDGHFSDVAGQVITFQIQVYGSPAPCQPSIQYVYADTVFGGTQATLDNGLSATVGYGKGSISGVSNAQFSFNTASLSAGLVVSILNGFNFVASSPFGTGSLQLDILDCLGATSYFMPVTLNAGIYPNGWLYGLDITWPEVISEYTGGYPFAGPISGLVTIGPFSNLPNLTFYACAIGLSPAGAPLATKTISYTIP